jgi:hypothetical protein
MHVLPLAGNVHNGVKSQFDPNRPFKRVNFPHPTGISHSVANLK